MTTTAVIYSDGSMECDRAITLLGGMDFELLIYKLGKDFSESAFTSEFGNSEYPQVAIGSSHIGGLKSLLNYLKEHSYYD